MSKGHKFTSAAVVHGNGYQPIPNVKRLGFPPVVHWKTFHDESIKILDIMVKLTKCERKFGRVTVQGDGFVYETEKWRVVYGEPVLDVKFPHALCDKALKERKRSE